MKMRAEAVPGSASDVCQLRISAQHALVNNRAEGNAPLTVQGLMGMLGPHGQLAERSLGRLDKALPLPAH
jgi:hypothetical protein